MPAIEPWLVPLGPVGSRLGLGLFVHRFIVGELNAIVGEDRVDRVGYGCDEFM